MSTYHKNKEQRMPNDKITAVGANIAEKAAMIWNVADMLRGPFKPHEYGLVILPMTVVKRFHDCLLPTHQAVLDTYEKVKKLQVIDGFLQKASGYQFYNTSRFTFETLLADPDNIESNFRDYLSGFSANAQDVLAKFDFDNIIKRMVESNTLYLVIKEFGSEKGYLGPDKISAVDCGYIFEDLVRRFSESFGEEAGAHFTSRDIIYLMTDLLLSEADLDTSSMTVYDMAMGTSQMLSCMEERIHELNSDIEVTCFGQEFNPSTFAIAKADMMIRGGDPNNMRFGDTLSEDQFPGFTFQYIISNPPFGIDWKREQKAVEAEAARGEMGRFAPGLPKISDGQQLFVLNGLAKLANKGKMAIIQNGSPLFSGDAGSGPSNIRQYILENDWLDCIIQLSTDMFMNTGISTYIWVLSKDKPAYRAGKVQLIDASHCFEPRRKSIGTKRNDITDVCRELIVTAYGEFANGKVYGDKNGIYCESKVFESLEFGYNKIVVERPQRDEAGNILLKRGKPVPDTSLRDTENVPLVQDIDAYFAREVLPYAPDAWIDHSKTKVGYEIPMTRYFYEYQAPEAVEDIVARITALEQDISAGSGGQIADGVLQAAKDLCRCHRVGTRQGRLRAGHPERCSRPRPQGAAGRDHFEDQREVQGRVHQCRPGAAYRPA
jgi:type I restriction enzyme M protein